MLIRFVIENVFSFGEKKEFSMIPYSRLQTLDSHKYKIDNFEILKLASVYGANGAGKSNLINALFLFQKLIIDEKTPYKLINSQFKLNEQNKDKQVFAIEFIQDNIPFYYGLEFNEEFIFTEELYISGLGRKKDELIYERKTNPDKTTELNFLKDFEDDQKSKILKSILIEEFIKPNVPILKLISKRDNKNLKNVRKAYEWFEKSLQIITPESKPTALPQLIDTDIKFKEFAENIMCTFNVGITSLKSEKKEINTFFGNEDFSQKIIKQVEESPNKLIRMISKGKDEIVIVKEEETIMVKQLKIGHIGNKKDDVFFDLEDESDGTIRLLDFVPAFNDIISKNMVYVIDEIERSIHPLLIKELIRKFSLDDQTKGQLIFTTHESNLLDQDIFRQDEIWFVEKDKSGSTDLYSLSDFKEHKTIDIRKGYLNGRYGSIPFLANLQELNWNKYDSDK